MDAGNPFADLIPQQTYQSPMLYSGATATSAPPAFVPVSQRGPRPKMTDFRDANGHIDGQAYHQAMLAWSGSAHGVAQLPGSSPTPTTGGGTSGSPAPAPTPLPPAASGGTGTGTTGGTANALSPSQALENFANSAGMKFQMEQGANAIQQLYAARGALQSGAAMKALQNYGQQTALNNYFMPYMGLLQGQQGVGAGAASSVAGVGSSFGNTATGILGGMGNAIGNGADATSNAALIRGQNNAALWNSIGGALGGLGSSFFPSGSY